GHGSQEACGYCNLFAHSPFLPNTLYKSPIRPSPTTLPSPPSVPRFVLTPLLLQAVHSRRGWGYPLNTL
ncbi:MAG: DUF2946 domain-containing protein, partial [Glaciimonas sp.]|nr:DUF2946 domain-containing protein [Glaciimonas sp.]